MGRYVSESSSTGTGAIVVSEASPTGGYNGQLWIQYDESNTSMAAWPAGNFIPAGTETEGGMCIGNYFWNNSWHNLIVAPIATGESTKLYKTTADASTNCQSLVDGYSNTNNNNNATHPAFQWARSLSIGGSSDWYLPAKDELHFIYPNKSILTAPYAFAATDYWSSTELSSATNTAWTEPMSTGNQGGTNKSGSYQVRAVRRLTL